MSSIARRISSGFGPRAWVLGLALTFAGCGDPLQSSAESIVLGRAATSAELYSTVAIDLPMGVCTGTLLRPDVVLTAAHCVVTLSGSVITQRLTPAQVTVIAGALTMDGATDEQRYAVAAITAHERYPANSNMGDDTSVGRHEEDLCLLRLARPITTLPVATVMPAAMADTALSAGTRLTVSGYGARRLEAGMPVDSGTLYLGETPFVRRTAKEFLAGAMGETDTCGGDSGGPAYLVIAGTRYLVGATARAREDTTGACGSGGIYTFVPAYADWIAANLPPAQPGGDGGAATDASAPVADVGAAAGPPANSGGFLRGL